MKSVYLEVVLSHQFYHHYSIIIEACLALSTAAEKILLQYTTIFSN